MRVLGNHHSLPWSKILLASLAKFPFSKICSLRSQIFRFLHASSKNLFASLTDFPFSICIFCLCFRSLRSRYVRKICSLRSQIFRFLYASSVSAFARFARDMFAKSVRFAHRFSVFYMHLLSLLFRFHFFSRMTFTHFSSSLPGLTSADTQSSLIVKTFVSSMKSFNDPSVMSVN